MILEPNARKTFFFFTCRLFSSTLKDRYGFVAPSALFTENRNPRSVEIDRNKKKKKGKEPYRPPSSLDRTGKKPIKSDLPFDFRFSYTESNPNTKPIGLREPKYSPFGPGRVDRPWTGVCAPAVDPVIRSVEADGADEAEKNMEVWQSKRKRILGDPLTPAERSFLIEHCQKHRTKRQVNLGRDGLTHNMLNDIHNNWKHAEAVRVKCLGVPTIDMKNVCDQLEEKTGGLIIHRHGGQIILYRGRNYNPKKRPVIPLMLWKPHEPIYPRLIKTVIEGLTVEETKEMRKKGLAVPALTKLAKNGYYASLVPMVRDAFLTDELLCIDCKGLPKSDYKKIGVKLRDLVPCILVTFEKEQIVIWRGKDCSVKSEEKSFSLVPELDENNIENELTDDDQSSDTESVRTDSELVD
ncbi:CRS2-associated factor 1, mitochondrial [Apostasia shenzhenica]|uniref:CRS2-associated factor 1, mitochondrial n=1 Tax=Apostasia shenzhenica TaxID=1088818 RepID=A0A2I0A5C4_9ASPA|nr:CRS2-associated factor 1, mitochondrial [Apostasia shenzhenica]